MVLVYIFLFVGALGFVNALKCYRTDVEVCFHLSGLYKFQTGKSVVVDDPTFVYCVSFPLLHDTPRKVLETNKTPKVHKVIADGMTEDEVDAPFDNFFDGNPPSYDVMSLCLFEVSFYRSLH